MSLDSLMIETFSINEVKDSIMKTCYAAPYIADNDKEPSWDGKIYLYNSTNKRKENLLGRVDVQVKGKESNDLTKKEITYPIKISDLKNYLNDKGVIYFVVYIDKNFNRKIYYSLLTPFKICELLKESKENRHSKNITLIEFPNDNKLKLKIIHDALKNFKLQASYIPDDKISISSDIFDEYIIPNNIYDIDTNKEFYLYGKIKGTDRILYPVGVIDRDTMEIKTCKNLTVSINDKIYYKQIEFLKTKDKDIIFIGKCIKITLIKNISQTKIRFDYTESIRQVTKDLEFFLDFLENKYFKIDGITIDAINFATEINPCDIENRKEELRYCKKIVCLLDKMGSNNDDLNISQLEDSDWRKLYYLISSIIDGNYIDNFKDNIGEVVSFDIANLKFLIFIDRKKTSKGFKYKLFDFFDYNFKKDAFKIYYTPSSEEFIVPNFLILNVLFNYKDLVNISNLNFGKCLLNLKSFEPNKQMLEYLNLFILNLIKAADTLEGEKRNLFLNAALEFNNYLIEKEEDDNTINFINKLQIIKRIRDLNENEKEILANIIANENNDSFLKIAAYLLLDQKEVARIIFNKLSEEEKETFEDFPINIFFD